MSRLATRLRATIVCNAEACERCLAEAIALDERGRDGSAICMRACARDFSDKAFAAAAQLQKTRA